MASSKLELESLKKLIDKIAGKIPIKSLTTDRNKAIIAYMRDEQIYVKHKYDFWHIYKGIVSKLREVTIFYTNTILFRKLN